MKRIQTFKNFLNEEKTGVNSYEFSSPPNNYTQQLKHLYLIKHIY